MNTTVRYHLTPTRIAIIFKKAIISISEDVEKMKLSYITGRNAKWCIYVGKQVLSF